jgi:orotidine-5'-phosphate decarboxylase
LIRSERRFDLLELNTPGVRLEGSSSDDQNKPKTPYQAFRAEVDRIVSDRDLTKSEDPAQTLDRMAEEAAKALAA